MARKQRLHRDRVHLRVDVEIADRGPRLGHLVDISMGGLCISGMGNTLSDVESARLSLRLPWAMAGRNSVELEARRSWLRPVEEGRVHAGYEIIECDDDNQLALEHLVVRFSGQEH